MSKPIDNIWELESFVKQRGAGIGTKYGFIGLGQGGGKIVDAFAGIRNVSTNEPCYPVLALNTNMGDIVNLTNVDKNNRIQLNGFEKGAGMNPEKGREALEANGEKVFKEISRVMKDVEVIVVVASLGGGTGTGAINLVIDVCADYVGKPVMAIVSIPSPHVDQNINAFEALKELTPKLKEYRSDGQGGEYRVLENLIILDNKKIIEEHIEAKERGEEEANIPWDKFSNYKVCSTLHEWNVITTLESDMTLDAQDFQNKILFTGGLLTFAKKKINLQDNNLKSEGDLINEIISTYRGKNVLANGFDYANDAIAFGINIVMPKNKEELINPNTLEKIKRKLQEELPGVPIYYGRSTWDSKHALVYTIVSLAGLPERAKKLREESEELLRLQEERLKSQSGFEIEGDLNIQQRKPSGGGRPRPSRGVPSNPFSSKKEVAASTEPSNMNPFLRRR